MSIRIGQVTVAPNGTCALPSPAGFDSVYAVRITNYSTSVVQLVNISSVDQSVEFLPPLSSMVFKSPNTGTVPFAVSTALGGGTALAGAALAALLTAEWANDPQSDLIGTYPAIVGKPA